MEPGVFVGELKRACAVHGCCSRPTRRARRMHVGARWLAPRRAREPPLRRHPPARAGPCACAGGWHLVELRVPRSREHVGYALAHDPWTGSSAARGRSASWSRSSSGCFRCRAGRRPCDAVSPPSRTLGVRRVARRSSDVHARCLEFSPIVPWRSRGAESTPNCASDANRVRLRRRKCPPLAPRRPWTCSSLAEQHGALTDDVNVYDGESALREARRVRMRCPRR